jgi:hypothetical protein
LPEVAAQTTITGLYLIDDRIGSASLWSDLINGQAHVPSPEQAPHPDARFSRAHGDSLGTRSAEPPSKERPEAADGSAPVQVRRRLIGNGSRAAIG